VGIDPTTTLPRSTPAISSISCLASSTCRKMDSARGRNVWPNEIKSTLRPNRSNSPVPSSFSSFRTCCESDGCARCSCSAERDPFLLLKDGHCFLENTLSAGFSRKFPDVQVSVVEELTSELLERVQDGTLDLALLALPIPGGHLVCQELFRERLHLVVPESHRLSSHSMVHLKQMDGRDYAQRSFREWSIYNHSSHGGGGTGVSVVPQMAVERRKGCRFIPIADEGAGIVQLKQHFRSRAHSTFLRHLQQSAAGMS
jgi:hypothetical protein